MFNYQTGNVLQVKFIGNFPKLFHSKLKDGWKECEQLIYIKSSFALY